MQVIIDGCKREYEVDAIEEIKRIKKLPCMQKSEEYEDESGNKKRIRKDFPEFMRYTRKIQYTKNGKEIERELVNRQKEKLYDRISDNYICPMNSLQVVLNEIKPASQSNTIPTKDFIVYIKGKANARQMEKITEYAKELELLSKDSMSDEEIMVYTERFNQILSELRKIKIKNPKTMSRLIEIALNTSTKGRKKDYSRYTRNLLNLLYHMDKDAFLQNFIQKCRISKKISA